MRASCSPVPSPEHTPRATRREALAAVALGLPLMGSTGPAVAAGPFEATPAHPLSRTLTDGELRAIFTAVSNRGRWGAADQRGTLNFVGPDQIRRAAASVRSGRSMGLSRPFPVARTAENPQPAAHHMTSAGDLGCDPSTGCMEIATDYIAIDVHGRMATHVDALCHIYRDGLMYNGVPASEIRSVGGARRNSVMTLRDGVASRGVLLDVPRALGLRYVEPERMITRAMIEKAERRQGVAAEPGDMLLIRTGRDVRHRLVGGDPAAVLRLAGLDPDVAAFLHARGVAVLGSDAIHDPAPFGQINRAWLNPIHICALASMGLHLIDNLWLDDAADACAALHRWSFQLVLAALPIEGGTGSPVNPVAIF